MATEDDILAQQSQLDLFRRKLGYNIKQQALMGVAAPFSLFEDIRIASESIQTIKITLRSWGVEVDDLPDDLPAAVAPLPPSPPQQVTQGLGALSEMLQLPTVRAAVVSFRTDFEATSQQIIMLGTYKDMHDLLHTLQFQCFNPVQREARRFPDDDTTCESLADYELTLADITTRLGSVAGQSADGSPPWINDLVQARTALHSAVETLDPKLLKRALWLLNRVLAVQPAQINTRLNAAARALRLPDLIKALGAVCSNLSPKQLATDNGRQFAAGVQALDGLHHALVAHVKDHDQWQAVDLELRRIEANLSQDTMELEMSWPTLKPMIEPLYSASAEDWATSIKVDCDKLDQAVATQDAVRMKQSFLRTRRQAGDRFYRVDAQLKHLCDDLREVGDPLASVLRLIP